MGLVCGREGPQGPQCGLLQAGGWRGVEGMSVGELLQVLRSSSSLKDLTNFQTTIDSFLDCSVLTSPSTALHPLLSA